MNAKVLVILAIISLVIGVLIVALYCARYANSVASRPRQQLLSERLQSTNKAVFACPAGHTFSLAVGTTQNGAHPISLRGTFNIRGDGREVQQGAIDPARLEPANWLDSVGLSAFILKLDDPNHLLRLVPGNVYDITVNLDDGSFGEASLWLCYLTSPPSESRQSK